MSKLHNNSMAIQWKFSWSSIDIILACYIKSYRNSFQRGRCSSAPVAWLTDWLTCWLTSRNDVVLFFSVRRARMKLASTYASPGEGAHEIGNFWSPGGGTHEIGKYLPILLIARRRRTWNWQVVAYMFDRRARAHMKLASTYVYFWSPGRGAHEISRAGSKYLCIFWPPGGGAHEIGKYLCIFLITGRDSSVGWKLHLWTTIDGAMLMITSMPLRMYKSQAKHCFLKRALKGQKIESELTKEGKEQHELQT
jgi:hypothetical protein